MTHMNVVMTSSRFGGRYFLDTLSRCCPDIVVMHEVMRKHTDSHSVLTKLTGLPLDRLKKMAEFEPEALWSTISESAKASGKNVAILAYYYHQPRDSALWDRIRNEARVVHLVRRNLFEAFVSRQAAFQNSSARQNTANGASQKGDGLMALNEKELRSYVVERTNDIEWCRQTFGSGNYRELFFEDISRTFGTCVHEINRLFPAADDTLSKDVRLSAPIRRALSNADRIADYAFVARFDRAYV
ncbi:hypothetical protein [Paracoccus aestuariivivens]|uniref:Sulfotransferase domain-containing protein n=1 Tax=Paracoccus aestuariivivens TaxID=1820333 RepID=A0A6L6JAY4_9RHOB|nr:hypothetical protein [Paracoccus aestuariivivens]MTH78355.1 hypothetical protein [Paracoccus aestuariivivens]